MPFVYRVVVVVVLCDDAAGVFCRADAIGVDESLLDGGLVGGDGRRDGEERVHGRSTSEECGCVGSEWEFAALSGGCARVGKIVLCRRKRAAVTQLFIFVPCELVGMESKTGNAH